MTSTDDRLMFIPTDVSPPDGFTHVHVDGYTTRARDYNSWLAAIKRHEVDNDRALAPDWIEEAEHRFCFTLPPGWCRYRDGGEQNVHLDRRMGIMDVVHGTQVLASFVAQGMPLVDQAEAERRGKICAGCYARDQIPGCSPCVGLSNLVADVVGAGKTSSDVVLEGKACLVCKCSARANIWIPVEVSNAGVTDEMMSQFPKSFCWKFQQIKALSENAQTSATRGPIAP